MQRPDITYMVNQDSVVRNQFAVNGTLLNTTQTPPKQPGPLYDYVPFIIVLDYADPVPETTMSSLLQWILDPSLRHQRTSPGV